MGEAGTVESELGPSVNNNVRATTAAVMGRTGCQCGSLGSLITRTKEHKGGSTTYMYIEVYNSKLEASFEARASGNQKPSLRPASFGRNNHTFLYRTVIKEQSFF